MSTEIISPGQLLVSLRALMPQVDRQTKPEATLDDGHGAKRPLRDWVQTAQKAIEAVQNITPEMAQLEQLTLTLAARTRQIPSEAAPAQLKHSLRELFHIISQKLFPDGISKKFADKQLGYLCSHYADFARALLKPHQEQLAINFFKFCLLAPSFSSHRNKDAFHWVSIFVVYPEIAERLMKSCLYQKLGHFPENLDFNLEKGVCLKMELWDVVQWVPIRLTPANLNTCLRLRNKSTKTPGITLTLEEVFKQFERQATPDLDVSLIGIINLNSELLGSKNVKGSLDWLDAAQWTEVKPSAILTIHELTNLYKEISGEPAYGFTLRAQSYSLGSSPPFFDFIMRLDDGDYRVIPMNAPLREGSVLHQQKTVFYALTKEQGQQVIDKVALDIKKNRELQAKGKAITPIDVQPYINTILGHSFYSHLDYLIEKLDPINSYQTKQEITDQWTQIKSNLDPDAFEQFMQQVVKKLVTLRDPVRINELIKASLEMLYFVLDAGKPSLPSEDEVRTALTSDPDLCKGSEDITKIGQSLLALMRLCFEVLHPYSIKVAEAEKETPILGRLFRIIEAIPWKWLKNLLNDLLILIVGPFRGYHYRTRTATPKNPLSRLVQTVRHLKPENYLNHASQLFYSYNDERKRQFMARMTKQSVLAVAHQET